MDEEILKLSANNTLTYHNARAKGYEWVMDIEEETPQDVVLASLRLVHQQGYQLGKPRYHWPEPGTQEHRGLYKPVDTPSRKDVSN